MSVLQWEPHHGVQFADLYSSGMEARTLEEKRKEKCLTRLHYEVKTQLRC